MNALRTLLIASLLAPALAFGQVAHEETSVTRDHTGVGLTPTTAAMTFAANALALVCVQTYDPGAGNPLISSVTLDGTTPFTQDITRQNSSTDSRGYIFSLPNVSAGAHTVVVTRSSAAANVVIYLMEVSGAATASPQDGVGVSATTTAANPASGTFTASVSDGFWLACFGNENAGTDATVAAGSGWTIPTNGSTTTGGTDVVSAVEYRANPGSTGAFNGNFTAASANYNALQFVYKAAGGGGGSSVVPHMIQQSAGNNAANDSEYDHSLVANAR